MRYIRGNEGEILGIISGDSEKLVKIWKKNEYPKAPSYSVIKTFNSHTSAISCIASLEGGHASFEEELKNPIILVSASTIDPFVCIYQGMDLKDIECIGKISIEGRNLVTSLAITQIQNGRIFLFTSSILFYCNTFC